MATGREGAGAGGAGRADAAGSRALPGHLLLGVDLAAVADVSAAIDRWGYRYLSRLFTPGELADTQGGDQASGLAARFAAKEATIKALAPAGEAPGWRSIEVRRVAGGACRLVLHGLARRLAADAGVERWSLSMTHEGPFAAAVVAGGARYPTGDDSPWTT